MGIRAVQKIDMQEAAALLESSTVLDVIDSDGLRATRLQTGDGVVVIIQGLSGTFIQVH